MKMKWEEPRIDVQQFTPNEYVAACYYGNCNISGEVFMDTNHNGRYDVDDDKYKYTNDACQHYFFRDGTGFAATTGKCFCSRIESGFGMSTLWVYLMRGHWEVYSATPVYNFDNVHVGDYGQHSHS